MRAYSRMALVAVTLLLVVCVSTSFVSADRASSQEKLAKYNARVGAKFLADKAKEDGVQALPSGVLYKVIEQGEGDKPTTKDTVKVSERGGEAIA